MNFEWELKRTEQKKDKYLRQREYKMQRFKVVNIIFLKKKNYSLIVYNIGCLKKYIEWYAREKWDRTIKGL